MRVFDSGATRSSSDNKPDYEGFLHPEVLRVFGQYMHSHRKQEDGSLRDSDNWQKGIPQDVLMKSLLRHVFDLWRMHRAGVDVLEDWEESKIKVDQLCAVLFNTQAYLLNLIKVARNQEELEADGATMSRASRKGAST